MAELDRARTLRTGASSLNCPSAMVYMSVTRSMGHDGSQLTVLFTLHNFLCMFQLCRGHISLYYALVARVPMVPGACGGFCTTVLIDKGVHFGGIIYPPITLDYVTAL